MKKITLLCAWLALGSASYAQNLIYATDFPEGPAPAGWTNEALGFEGETDFYFGDTYLPGSDFFSAPAAMVNDDISWDENTISRLTSPSFDTSGYTTVTLSFEYGLSQTEDHMGTLKIEVYDGSGWEQILYVDTDVPPVSSGDIDVTEYKNAAFQVRYTYNDQGSSSWGCGVTDFLLEGTYEIVPNDEIAGAFPLICGQALTGTTITATAETGVPVCNSVDGNTIGVWYKFTNPGNQSDVTVSLCGSDSDFDTRLSVFKGTIEALECVTANDNSCEDYSSLSFAYDGYTTYYILVSGAETTGDFAIAVSCSPVPPENDEIVNAIDVDQHDQPYTHHAVPLIYATTEEDGTDFTLTGCDTGVQQNVFYKFTATANGTATVSLGTPNPGGLSLITFYTAADESAEIADLVWVNQPTNQCNGFSDTRTINTTAGTTYYVTLMMPDTNSDVTIDITSSLGTGDHTIAGLKFYPNPVQAHLQFESLQPLENISVINMIGQEVMNISPGNDRSIDMGSIPSGTYLLKVQSNNQVGIYKIVKR